MAQKIKIALAQLNLTLGDIKGNTEKIIRSIKQSRDELEVDLILFPELAINGYAVNDLLTRPDFYKQTQEALERIQAHARKIDVVVGYAQEIEDKHFNTAAWIRDGQIIKNYHKQKLCEHPMFNENKYFDNCKTCNLRNTENCPGSTPNATTLKGVTFSILICEDIWHEELVASSKQQGAQIILSLNASPYWIGKSRFRETILTKNAKNSEMPIFYTNMVGGQDDLVFDGESFAIDQHGEICASAGFFQEKIITIDIDENLSIPKQPLPKSLTKIESLYRALTLGVKDYVHKNRFNEVLIGVSGGIDSALTLAIAVDALGSENVTAVFMPSKYTSKLSHEAVESIAKNFDVKLEIIPIHKIYKNILTGLKKQFANTEHDIAEENIQARIRGMLLMALSNKKGGLVLTAGNKSETAVGYCTLYGDTAGGLNVLQDVYKTTVYELANYRNTLSNDIPQAVIDRPPSAELAPGQIDENSLPPYGELDQILKLFIEEQKDIEEILKLGLDETIVRDIVEKIFSNEFKRYQSSIGITISKNSFSHNWNYPTTYAFKF